MRYAALVHPCTSQGAPYISELIGASLTQRKECSAPRAKGRMRRINGSLSGVPAQRMTKRPNNTLNGAFMS
jgi:hypothetical protein